ncbi:MAG: TetR/AcrR family transcriptional regulator [Treponema sp.]|jgi:AcrR family transcriptional regulator|nr:TetR/AcrR family transcriptional regulator [Treponema sp.]
MGITERRKREKTERRKAILNCARELILSQGVERVNMDDIARKAELSKATLYLYFPGKEILFNEICEESARFFLDHVKPLLETGVSGMDAMRCFWRGYVELFGNFDEMLIIFKVRSFLNPGLPFISMEEQTKSPNVYSILLILKTLIEQCKAEGLFDPALDSEMATRLLLSMFSTTIDNTARLPAETRKSPARLNEMTKAFQLIVYGFAREGINRSSLNITE